LAGIDFFEPLSELAVVRFFRSFEALDSFSADRLEGPSRMFDFFESLGPSTIVDGTPKRALSVGVHLPVFCPRERMLDHVSQRQLGVEEGWP
jgi:hypothetical protein